MDYLHAELAQPLIEAVCDICLKKPEDPIEHLAHYLYRYHQLHMQEKKSVCVKEPAIASTSHASPVPGPSNLNRASSAPITPQPSPHPSTDTMEAEHMDYLDFDLPASKETSAASSVEMMMTSNEKSAIHVHQDAIKIQEDLFDDDDLL